MNASSPLNRHPESAARTPSCSGQSSYRLNGFASWTDFVHDHFPWLEHRNHARDHFEAKVNAYRFTGGALSAIRASASEVIRTQRLADAADTGFIKFILQMSGRLQVEQDGRSGVLEAAQVTVFDTARPYRIRLSDRASFSVLMLPYDAIPDWTRIGKLTCGAALIDCATTCAAFGALMALISQPSEILTTEGETALRAVRWMLTTSLRRSAGIAHTDDQQDARLHRARRYIVENLSNPGLNADKLASAMCMSRRALYLFLSGHKTTPSRMIQDFRLEKALQLIEDPINSGRKATDLAYDLGFNDYATFSRAFKKRFGMSPMDCRQKPAGPSRTHQKLAERLTPGRSQ